MKNNRQFFDMIPDYESGTLTAENKAIFEAELKTNHALQRRLAISSQVEKGFEYLAAKERFKQLYSQLKAEDEPISFTPQLNPVEHKDTGNELRPVIRQNLFYQYYSRAAAVLLPFLIGGGLWLHQGLKSETMAAQKASAEIDLSTLNSIVETTYKKGEGGESDLEEKYKKLKTNITEAHQLVKEMEILAVGYKSKNVLSVEDKEKLALANFKIGNLERGKELLKEVLSELKNEDKNKQKIKDILKTLER